MNNCNCGKHSVPAAQIVPVNCDFVIPASYPYVRPVTDSYTCCCCGSTNPAMKDYPSSGPYKGNAFVLDNANPYLMDTTYLAYGQALDFSENIYTRVTKRDDPSCINLAARFDFTDSSLTNTVRFDFLKNYTARKYEELAGVLPIVKNGIKFRIHYTVYNIDGGVEYEGHTDCKVDTPRFHFTSIKDVFVMSANGLIIDNIPAMTFQGRYNITITHVEAFVEVINTKEHLADASLNPFYTFTDNNRKILLQEHEISETPADDSILIGDCEVRQSFEYFANVTTRLRLTFVAFTTLPISCGDTSPIWFALNEPTEQSITQLRNEVSALEDEVAALHAKDAAQDAKIAQLEGQVALNTQNIAALMSRVSQLETNDVTQDLEIQRLKERVTALESTTKALVYYKANKELIQSQLTWKGYGQLYQVSETYYATGDFENDVRLGYLVPVAADSEDVSALVERIEEVAGIAEDADSTATATAETVGTLTTTVSDLSETVGTMSNVVSSHTETLGTINGEITDLDTRVGNLEEAEQSKNKVVVKNLTTGAKQYVNSYGAAATILKEDLEGSYKVYPGEGYSQNTITQETFMNVTSLKEIELPDSTYELGKKAFYNSGITSFNITSHITSMGVDVFGECADLATVTINSPDLELNSGAFTNCTNLVNLTITAVKKIMTSAFYNTGIASAEVPSSCTFINTGAFGKCLNLTTITIDAADINDHIVSSSSALETIELLSHVSTMHGSAFEGAPSGMTINIHKSQDTIAGSPWGATNATINWGVN